MSSNIKRHIYTSVISLCLWKIILSKRNKKQWDRKTSSSQLSNSSDARGEGGVEVDWCYFYYFVRNRSVDSLEALYAQIFSLDSWISGFPGHFFFVVVVRSLTKPFFRLSQCGWVNNDWCGLMKRWRLRRESLTQHQTSQGSWDLTDRRPTTGGHGSRVKVNDTSVSSISNTTSGETAQSTYFKATNKSTRKHRKTSWSLDTV